MELLCAVECTLNNFARTVSAVYLGPTVSIIVNSSRSSLPEKRSSTYLSGSPRYQASRFNPWVADCRSGTISTDFVMQPSSGFGTRDCSILAGQGIDDGVRQMYSG